MTTALEKFQQLQEAMEPKEVGRKAAQMFVQFKSVEVKANEIDEEMKDLTVQLKALSDDAKGTDAPNRMGSAVKSLARTLTKESANVEKAATQLKASTTKVITALVDLRGMLT